MLVIMESTAKPEEVTVVCEKILAMGHTAHPVGGLNRTVIAVTGNERVIDSDSIRILEGVAEIVRVTRPYQLASRETHQTDTVVKVMGIAVGGENFVVMAGPCSVETKEQLFATAEGVARAGAKILRAGAFKPRTSPYSFQGLGEEGLKMLAEVRDKFGLAIVTEAVDIDSLDLVAEYADLIQIGARNMQNYSLLKKAGKIGRPILLKRGMWATLEEFLMSAEYILAGGNDQVILCERGVRTSASGSTQVLDLASVPYLKKMCHLPIICDPSHSSGARYKVPAMARASLAAGADGLLIEVHHAPEEARSDGPQAITLADFDALMKQITAMAPIMNRTT